MTQMVLFDAEVERDLALAGVGSAAEKSNSFMSRGLAALAGLEGEYTGEQVRNLITAQGITPHHHNAWGALIARGVWAGLLIPTGRYVPMRGPKSHARRTQVLTATGGQR